jgi:tRNA pseudouridine55 synthase
MLGVVNLDKPVGPTSHDMVGLLRRLTGIRRIGHAGTLDPLASGVLPILVDGATRFSEELTGGSKRYEALIRLGQRSATDDGEGPIVAGEGPLPGEEAAREALHGLVGTFEQLPPAFSARKAGGHVAHRSARSGTALELPPRTVTVSAIDVLEISPGESWLDIRIDLRCGPGTYVRSIARDLGERLGCGGYLAALRRTEAAGLRVEDAVSPRDLEHLAAEGRIGEALLAVGELLPLPRLALDPSEAVRFAHGVAQRVAGAGGGDGAGRMAVYDGDRLLGVGTLRAGLLQPDKVIASGAPDA